MHASFPRNTVFFSIVLHFLSLSHSLAPDTSLCVLVCMRVQVCEETREKCYMSCQSLCFISLRQDCSLSPELAVYWLGISQQNPEILLSPHPTVLVLQVHAWSFPAFHKDPNLPPRTCAASAIIH